MDSPLWLPYHSSKSPISSIPPLPDRSAREGCQFRVRQGLQVGAVVQYLGDGGPRELLALELEDHQSTVLVDAQKVNEAGLDRNLSANQREPAHQHVGVRHQHGFQHLFRFNPPGQSEFGSGLGSRVDLPDPDVSLHVVLSKAWNRLVVVSCSARPSEALTPRPHHPPTTIPRDRRPAPQSLASAHRCRARSTSQ